MSETLGIPDFAVMREPLTRRLKPILLHVGIYLAYLGTAYLGLSIQPTNTFATTIWPPIGIALVVFTMYGYRFVPSVALAALSINLYLGASPFSALLIATGNTLGPLAGAYLLKHSIGFRPPTLRLRDNIGIIVIGLFVSVMTASIGVTSLLIGGSIEFGMLGATWTTWWIGDLLGILIFAPLLFKWLYWPQRRRTRLEILEAWAAIAAVAGTSFLIFWMPQTYFSYYLFIPLTWMALRVGPRGTSSAVFVATAIAVSGTLLGYGPFAEAGLLYLQIFVATMSALYLIFSAVVEERRHTLRNSQVHIDELEHALARIQSEDEAKKEFLAVLAHELRNPLAAVLSSVELLKIQGVENPEAPTHVKAIGEHVHAMAGLLDDLLDISRISKKKFKLQKEVIPIGPVIDRSVRAAQRLLRSLGHTLLVTKQEEEIFVEADPIRLEQIITNLLNNAAKYTEEQGTIEIILRREDSMTVIRVRDSGIGIPGTMLTRIFEPFFQIDHGKPTTEGLGIGLALTRQLVEMHSGTIEATSPGEGLGSEFIVRLPYLPPPSEAPADSPKTPKKHTPHTKHPFRILVVDDNRAAADALCKLLTLRGHTVEAAYTAQDALERRAGFDPHIVILDIGLPDMNGYEVARLLRQEQFGGTLIALTGYGQESDKERGRDVGFQIHLTKPVGLKEIEAVLNHLPRPKA